MKLTIAALLDKNPCDESRKFIKSHKTLRQMWAKCERVDWMIWALKQFDLLDDRTARILAVACAEHALHFFEDKYPDDKRPRQAIEFARTLIDNPAAASAAVAWSDAAAAAWAAASAAADARSAAAAAWAANSAAADARSAAAAAAAWAAASAADAAENRWQADKLRSLIDPFKKQPAKLKEAA